MADGALELFDLSQPDDVRAVEVERPATTAGLGLTERDVELVTQL